LEANRLILETLKRRVDGEVGSECSLEGEGEVEAGAMIQHSVVRGPAIIGTDTRIEHSYIGPYTSIMNNVEIHGSEVEHSIVLEGSTITDLANRVVDSLIGKNVRIYRQSG
jgi:glucose-1-phosphate thymidylyltransferase